jgi:hypothetical protein
MGQTLADITLKAQRLVDHLTTEVSGKWSTAWWNALINDAKDVVAAETGFNRALVELAITESTNYTALPAAMCYGIRSIYIGTDRVEIVDEVTMDEKFPGWRNQTTETGQPEYAVVTNPNIEWYPLPDDDYTATVSLSTVPDDLATGTDTVDGLPATFGSVIAYGAAALASVGDLYTTSQEARENFAFQSFWNGIDRLKAYLHTISKSDETPIFGKYATTSTPDDIAYSTANL